MESSESSVPEVAAEPTKKRAARRAPGTANRSRGKARKKAQTFDGMVLDRQGVLDLRRFVLFAIGDPHNSVWEDRFINDLYQMVWSDKLRLTGKQWTKVGEIKDKLRFDRPDDPLPPVDPDGIVENQDPDGWPADTRAGSDSEEAARLGFDDAEDE